MKTNTNRIAKAFNLTKSEFKEFWRDVQKLVPDRSLSKIDVESAFNSCLQQGIEQPTPDDAADIIVPARQAERAKRQAELAAREAERIAQQQKEEDDKRCKEHIVALVVCICKKMEELNASSSMAEIEKGKKAVSESTNDFEQKIAIFEQEKQELQLKFAKLLADKKKLNDKLKAARNHVKSLKGAKAQNNTNLVARSSFSLGNVNPNTRSKFWDNIYDPCVQKIARDYNFVFRTFQSAVENGTRPLTKEQLIPYIACYGGHHYHKLREAFSATSFANLSNERVQIIDWGCGQAVATCVLLDYLLEKNISLDITCVTLIEPSQHALDEGVNYVEAILCGVLNVRHFVKMINASVDNLTDEQVATYPSDVKIHLFSNILDVAGIDLPKLVTRISRCSPGKNHFICSSPSGPGSQRLMDFRDLFAAKYDLLDERFVDELMYKTYYSFRYYPASYRPDRITRHERQFTVIL